MDKYGWQITEDKLWNTAAKQSAHCHIGPADTWERPVKNTDPVSSRNKLNNPVSNVVFHSAEYPSAINGNRDDMFLSHCQQLIRYQSGNAGQWEI